MIEILLAPANMFMLGMASAFYMSSWVHVSMKADKREDKTEDVTECVRD